MNAINFQHYISQIQQWKNEGVETTEIIFRLQQQNLSEDMVNNVLNEWKKLHYAKKRNAGFIWVGTGGAIMLISFIISMLLFEKGQSFTFVLYTFTFLGIAIVFKGLIDILGW